MNGPDRVPGLDPLLHGHQLTLEAPHLPLYSMVFILPAGPASAFTGTGTGLRCDARHASLAHLTHLRSSGNH